MYFITVFLFSEISFMVCYNKVSFILIIKKKSSSSSHYLSEGLDGETTDHNVKPNHVIHWKGIPFFSYKEEGDFFPPIICQPCSFMFNCKQKAE